MTTPAAAGTARYRHDAVTTAGPAQLVLMLFDGALAAVGRAAHALADGPADQAHVELTRAQDIVLELQMSLDHEAGGPIAGSLDALYGFCLERLVAANVGKDPEPLRPVAKVLGEIRDAWDAVASGGVT